MKTPAECAAFLEGACGGDTELRRRVASLLAAHEQSGDLLDAPSGGAAAGPRPDVAPRSGPLDAADSSQPILKRPLEP